ncbi:hypothetical protein RB653_005014 [Dictyostelium firmibasis]|uniref:Actin-binding protein F n=1 Tax=Dictyostelium firmibasis TaxID=79012 RepID=A0AAN7U8N3_9MYCE
MTVSNNKKFEENYVLACDIEEKEKLLGTLIGGSPQYFYYNVIHLLNVDPTLSDSKNREKYQRLMKDWSPESKPTIPTPYGASNPSHESIQQYKSIDLRQKLLSFRQENTNPSALTNNVNDMFEELRYLFGLTFSYTQTTHQTIDTPVTSSHDDKSDSTLDESIVNKKTVIESIINNYPYKADYITPNSFEYVLNNYSLPEAVEKKIVQKLKYPIVSNDKLQQLLSNHKGSFGSLALHQNLTLEQMEKYIEKNPENLDSVYVKSYLEKLTPTNELHDWETIKSAQDHFYQTASKFVTTLPNSLNTYKLLVYHHYIKFQIADNKYDQSTIEKYFQLPRDTYYYIEPVDRLKPNPQLSKFNDSFNGLKPVSQDDDEKLISFLLKKLFLKENSIKPYQSYFRPTYLNLLLAESKLLSNDSSPEKWIEIIDNHSKVQELKDRVDIEFLPTNREYYHPDDDVVIDCAIKNVNTLLVKVFEISTFNYYKSENKKIDSNINLDGLIASQELSFDYSDQPPIQKSDKKFDFPSLKGKRGIFVIEFIGNGKSSRSMIQKGDLHFISETSPIGQVIKVIDQDSIKVQKSSVYIDGNTYKSNEDGDIKIPFSSTTSQKNIILMANIGDSDVFASLKKFTHQSEQYSLSGGIFVDNSCLLQNEKAPIVVRVKLFLGDTQISNNYLEEPSLTITSSDNSESPVVNSKEIKPFVLYDNKESIYQYKVQEGLNSLNVRFEAKVRALSRNNNQETLSFEASFQVNTINNTDQISEYYLERCVAKDGSLAYQLCHLGKGGDPLSHGDVSLEFQHWLTTERIYTTLKTDKNGIIHLGALNDVQQLNVNGLHSTFTFPIKRQQQFTYPNQINIKLGELIRLPYLGNEKSVSHSQINFFQLGGSDDKNFVVHDLLKKSVNIENKNELVIGGLDIGRYLLILAGSIQSCSTTEILIDVVDGQVREGYLVGPSRILSYKESIAKSLFFDTTVDAKHNQLQVKFKNYTPSTRVHVFSSYFEPTNSLDASLSLTNGSLSYQEYSVKPKSLYFNGRSLGDEVNYILNRKTTKKLLPGNSLKKPSILVQPWSIGKTTHSQDSLKESSKFRNAEAMDERSSRNRRMEKRREVGATRSPFLEFLSHPSILLLNLEPSADTGIVNVDLSQLIEAGSTIYIYAVDNDSIFTKEIAIDKSTSINHFKDTKLVRPLDSSLHYKEEKLITPVVQNSPFEILNVNSSKYTVYDSLDKVLSLMKTLNKSYLQDFSFISEWESLSFEKKKEKFSKFTCHELNFFIFKKDKEFFGQVVLPLIQTKGYKTFIDHFLCGDKKNLEIFIIDSNRFNTLNALEMVLLGELFPEHSDSISNLFKQKVNFSPISPSQYDTNFKIALNQLDTDMESLKDDSDEFPNSRNLSSIGGGGVNFYDSNNNNNNNNNNKNIATMAFCSNMSAANAPGMSMKKKMVSRESDMKLGSAGPPPPMASMGAPTPMLMRAVPSPAPPPPAPTTRAYEAPQLYQPIEKTEELAETYYYKQLNPHSSLIPVNEFWLDYANHIAKNNQNKSPFVSKYIAFSNSSFAESMMALSVLDLPFTVKDNTTQVRPKNGKLSMKPTTPIVVFHQELVSGDIEKQSDILVTQHFFDPQNQYSYNDGENEEIYIDDQFLVSKVYCAMVVIANLSSKQKKLDVLLEIPKGSIAVGPSPFVTRSKSVNLSAYSTTRLQYHFYFPESGRFPHFPAHVSEKQNIIASVVPFTFNVVLKPSIVNHLSWEYIANQGTVESILDYLTKGNLYRVDFYHLYHRYNDKKIWEKVIEHLKKLKFYESTTWSFSIHHKNFFYLKDYLSERVHSLSLKSIDAPSIYIDPFENNFIKFLEYSPLVNSRTHQIGDERKILNNKLSNQYYEFCSLLSFKLDPSDTELLSLAYYLLLQDRFEESIKIMKRIGKHPVLTPKLLLSSATINDSKPSSHSTLSNTASTTTIDSAKDKKKLEKEEKQREKERKQKEKEEKKKEKEELKRKEKEEKKKKEEEKKSKKKSGSEVSSPSADPTIATSTTQTSSTIANAASPTSTTHHDPIKPEKIASDDEHDDEHEGDDDDEDDDEPLIDMSEFNPPSCLPEMKVQYDYLLSYLDFFNPNPTVAAENSKKYENYPVQRWNSLFKDLRNKVDQVSNKDSVEIDYEKEIDRERRQNKMASNEPTFDISSESNRTISVNYSNLVDITVSYYVMDIEHLFSANPFVQQELGHFLYVSPNKKESFLLKDKSGTFNFKIPDEFSNSNVVIDVVSAQIHHNITVYSNNLSVYITEKVGQLRVVHKQKSQPISKTYIKVYSKNKNGVVEFFKDGYTDIAGYFDYSTVSTLDISNVSKLSILVLSNQYGAVIKEAKPPGF